MIKNQNLVEAKIAELTTKFKTTIKPDVNPKITIRYDLKGRSAAGTCRAVSVQEQRFEIRLNKTMLELLGSEYVDEVVTHEFCHAARHMAYPPDSPFGRRKPHGPLFYAVGRKLGVELNRTTDLLTKLDALVPAAVPKAKSGKTDPTDPFGIFRKRQERGIIAICTCCQKEIPITKNRATRMAGGKKYYHATCGALRARKALVIK